MPATVEARLAAFARRPRPIAPSLHALDAAAWPEPAREAARLAWTRRVAGESQSVEVAIALREAYVQSGVTLAHVDDAIARLEDDERAHVALCCAFLRAIGSAPPEGAQTPPLEDDDRTPSLRFLSYVLTGLAICESVSALRFAAVRAHTDLPVPRACIDHFLRDETAHARLGFDLLPIALAHHSRVAGAATAARDVARELRETFRHLDLVVGLDAERRGMPLVARAQPDSNPGVVEPALDALALYRGVERSIAPRLDRLGLDRLGVSASTAWKARWA